MIKYFSLLALADFRARARLHLGRLLGLLLCFFLLNCRAFGAYIEKRLFIIIIPVCNVLILGSQNGTPHFNM